MAGLGYVCDEMIQQISDAIVVIVTKLCRLEKYKGEWENDVGNLIRDDAAGYVVKVVVKSIVEYTMTQDCEAELLERAQASQDFGYHMQRHPLKWIRCHS